MKHLPHTATRQTTAPETAVRSYYWVTSVDSTEETTQEATDNCTFDDELLARMDAWMGRHPSAANVIAYGSLAALVLLMAVVVAEAIR